MALVCGALGTPRSWLYYKPRRSRRPAPLRRPDVETEIWRLLSECPATYGYRRLHALLLRKGIHCNPKTVWRALRRRSWLASGRSKLAKPTRRHFGQVGVERPNKRWASDISGIRAWDGRKGRLAMIIDCGDRSILAWRFARTISGADLGELLHEAIHSRFGQDWGAAAGIEILSDNGPEYTSVEFKTAAQSLGLVACRTPRRSPQSNGIAERFFGSFKRDYVYQGCLSTREDVERSLPGWIEHYNTVAPHSSLGMRAPKEYYDAWLASNRS